MSSLQGHIAIISGGLGDIGHATALELARRGADIALGDLLEANDAEKFLAPIRAMGRRAVYFKVDVTDANALEAWYASVEKQLGIATLIISNAAIVTVETCLKITPEQWRREFAVNLDGAFFMAQIGAKKLVAAGKPGRIVFVGSWAGHRAHPHIPAYSSTKAALRMICQCMALELAPRGILVNEVAPGYVAAGLTGKMLQQHPASRKVLEAKVPSHELISAHQCALNVAFLCEPENCHMVGSLLLMDGGLSLQSGKQD